MAIKRKDHERLDDANIERVIGLLEQEKPITIVAACAELNIANNGTRLRKIIQDYKERKELEKKRRAANRGKPATDFEITTVIEGFLAGETYKDLSEQLFRSVDFVKKIIDEVGVPQAKAGENYSDFSALPDQCVSDSFEKGEYVWSSRYGAIAEVDKHLGKSADGLSEVYRIYVHQRIDEDRMLIDGKRYGHHVAAGGGFYANQCAYDLGSLKHLHKYGIDLKRAIK